MLMHKREKIAIVWFFALVGVLPIAVMAYLSLISNVDILNSKYIPSKRDNSVTFFAPLNAGDSSSAQSVSSVKVAATTLGQIFIGKKEIRNLNSVSTKYARIENSLWALSADKGLFEISLGEKTDKARSANGAGELKAHYNWKFFEESYKNFDPTRFYISGDILPEHFVWLADRLNSSPSIPEDASDNFAGDSVGYKQTISDIVGINFYPSQELINQLNWMLTNEKAMNKLFSHWKLWNGWLNPRINALLNKQNRAERDNRILFRWILSELFPNRISRFRYFPWEDIWVSQIVSMGYSMIEAKNKIVIGMMGEMFPGIAIFDAYSRDIIWVTESTGLPNASIHSLSQISEDEILATHDLGTSIIQFASGKVVSSSLNVFNNAGVDSASQAAAADYVKQYSEKFIPPQGSRAFQWSNYQDVAKMMPLGKFMANSAIISFGIAFLCTLFAVFPSYAIARMRFKGRKIFSKAVLSTQVLSGLPFLIPVFVIFVLLQMRGTHLFNSYSSIIFVNLIFFLPLSIQFLFNIFAILPANLEESAIIDGCTPWQAFRKVILPSTKYGIIACFSYVFLFAWDEILFIWILSTDLTTATLPVGIRMAVGQFANRPELLMAFCVIASVPVIILFLISHQFLIKSLTGRR